MKLRVTVVLALPTRQEVVELELEEGATVAEAIAASSFAARYPELDVGAMPALKPSSTRSRSGR